MKKSLLFLILFYTVAARAQKIDSIYVNLYTDSLKKGTYNYINVDGLLSNGKYIPLDSSHIIFSSSYGKFYGNNLFIENNIYNDAVTISVRLKENPAVKKKFILFIKTKEEEKLKTTEELLQEMKQQQKKKNKSI